MPGFARRTLGRLQDAAATASARSTAQQAAAVGRLEQATRRLNQTQQAANQIAREHARLVAAGNHEEAAHAAQAYERQIRRENAALQERNQILEEQRGLASRVAQSAGQHLSTGIGNAATATITRMRGQIERAHHALLQNTRRFSDITGTGLANAVAGYTGALAQAIETGIKYGQSVDEITQIQHNLVDMMNIDVTQGGWVQSISAITDDFANMASRQGRAVAEIAAAQIEMERTFGSGTRAEMEAFANQMSQVSMIPEVLRNRMEAVGEEVGQLFNNREMAMMIEHWTEQFGDQNTNLAQMTTNMMLFRQQAQRAGYSLRDVNVMTNALAQGTVGRRGHSAMTLRAGRDLQQRFAGASERDQTAMLSELEGNDRTRAEEALRSSSGLDASSAFHLLRGTTAGIDAMLDNLVGVYGQNTAIAGEMLEAQGFGTGDTRTNEALAMLLDQRRAGADNTAEIQELISAAEGREREQQEARDNQYVNVAATAHAAETSVDLLADVVRNTSGGGAIVAGLAGVAAVMAHAFPALGNEWRDIFEGRVTMNTGETATSGPTQGTLDRQAAATSATRQQLQGLFDSGDFDPKSDEGHQMLLGILSRARRDVTDEQFASIMQKVDDLGFSDSDLLGTTLYSERGLAEEAARMATSGRAGEGAGAMPAGYEPAARPAAPTTPASVTDDRARRAALTAPARPPTPRTTPAATPPSAPAVPDRAATAGAVIDRAATPAATTPSAPTPPTTPAPTAPAAGSTPGRTGSLTTAGRGVLASNGGLEIPFTLNISNWNNVISQTNARNMQPQPWGQGTG